MAKRVIYVGIASPQQQKARMMAIARGEHKPSKNEPKIWFSSIESLGQVLSTKNQLLLEMIAKSKPASVTELAKLSGRAPGNLSRTLKTLEKYGLVSLERHGRSVAPVSACSKLEIGLPLDGSMPSMPAIKARMADPNSTNRIAR